MTISCGKQMSRSAVLDEFAANREVCCNDGKTTAHSLNLYETKAFIARWKQENSVFRIFLFHIALVAV